MKRYTEEIWKGKYTYAGKDKSAKEYALWVDEAIHKLGKLEDLMEKYEIESPEALEEIIKDYDDMAKSIVEMGLGVKVEIKGKSEEDGNKNS